MRIATLAAALGLIVCTMGVAGVDRPTPQTHTVTSTAGSFDSKDIQADKSWKFTIRETGDFAYICTFHPTMKATLRVTS